MTIKQLHEITPADQKIYIGWNGSIMELHRGDALEMLGYGDYKIGNIQALAENKIEADLLAQPVQE